jgi:hypothetical protein
MSFHVYVSSTLETKKLLKDVSVKLSVGADESEEEVVTLKLPLSVTNWAVPWFSNVLLT